MRKRRNHQDIQTLRQAISFVPFSFDSGAREERITEPEEVEAGPKTDIFFFLCALTSEAVDFQQTRAKQRHMRLLGVEDSSQDAED